MWMTFAVYANYVNTMITGGNDPRTVRVCALNAKMVVGTQNEAAGNTGTNGLFIVDFIADQGRKIGSNVDKIYKGTIANRNSTVGNDYLNDPNTGDARLGSPSVYSVDVAVLPDTPSDPDTGLPVPTILAVCGRSDIVHGTGLEVCAAYQLSIDIQINAKAALLYLGYPGSAIAYRGSFTIGAGTQTVYFVAKSTELHVQPGTYDGFIYSLVFAVAPATVDVGVICVREV